MAANGDELLLVRVCVMSGTPPMSDEDEIHLHVAYASHLDMDDAFCACMRIAIAAGLESAPDGVITTPGTRNPKFVSANPVVRLSGRGDF
jgi:hypothetical protein